MVGGTSLGPPFILCPMSDRKQLLGMAEDKSRDKAILTIGKNIAISYHILEQKQETSWTMSRHWFTSPVVYCKEINKYAAILDNNTLALWDELDTSLDSVEKIKFAEPVFRLFPTTTETFVVFENGFVSPLGKVYGEGKKTKGIATDHGVFDPQLETIVDCFIKGDDEEEEVVVITVPKGQNEGRHCQKRKTLKMYVTHKGTVVFEYTVGSEEPNKEILGHCILPTTTSSPVSLIYLDKEGRMLQLCGSSRAEQTEPVESRIVGQLGNSISLKTATVMRPVGAGSSDVVVYGSDSSEEGAVVLIYDLKYDLVVTKQGLKLYGTPPIMDVVGSNILIPVGLHVLVLALRVSKSLLSDMVGQHGIRGGDEVFEQRAPFETTDHDHGRSGWNVDSDIVSKRTSLSKKAKKEARELQMLKASFPSFWEVIQQCRLLEKEGHPQALICNQIVPGLLEPEKENLEAVNWMLNTFYDIPEHHLVTILAFLLKKLPAPTEMEGKCNSGECPELGTLIQREIDTNKLTAALQSLDFDTVLLFVSYLRCRIENMMPTEVDQVPNESMGGQEDDCIAQCVQWLSCLLDSHYTHFVLGGQVPLVEKLLKMVKHSTEWLEGIAELEPYLLLIQKKIDLTPKPHPRSKWRTEVLTFD